MFSVRLRFAVFALLVLGAPALLMGSHQPDLRDLGKLVMILSPALAGNLLAVGLARARFQTRPAAILRAAGVTLSIVLGATGVALALGAAGFAPTHASPRALAVAMAASGLTSILEELGWALGGLTLARAAFGERGGVLMLGGVWAL